MYQEWHLTGLHEQKTTPLKGEEFLEDHIKDSKGQTLEKTGPKLKKNKKQHI